MLNSLKYAIKLEEVGFTRDQAQTQMLIMTEIIETNLATKQDMKDLRTELHHDMKQMEYRMTIKLGGIVSMAIGIAVALGKML